jgi:excisionase family DNA binding protein
MAEQSPRILTLTDVAEILNTSSAQVYALVRRKELRAFKLGGRGQWRVEASVLEDFIARMYVETDAYIDEHPFAETDENSPTSQPTPSQE